MSRTIKTWLLLLSLSFTIFSCEKEYSLENGGFINGGGTQGGTAKFTFDGAPGGCTTPSILGTYTAGTALTPAEKITLVVTVTEAGTYTITTGTANGISFSGAGTFTSTGQQFIELTATGSTPTAAGTFSYVPGTNGCNFSITYLVSAGSSSGTAVYTLKGAPDDCTAPVITGPFVAGTPLTAASSIQVTAVVTTPGTYTISTGTANGVKFSATGTFAAMGEFPITLTSTDTPTSAGTGITYTPGTNGCSFTVNFTAGSTGTNYFRAKIGAATTFTNFDQALTGTVTVASPATAADIDGSTTANESLTFQLTSPSGPLTTGAYGITNPARLGFPLYINAAGNWTIGTMGQSGTFTITLTAITANRLTGTFSGSLYDNSGAGTNATVFNGGEFSVPY